MFHSVFSKTALLLAAFKASLCSLAGSSESNMVAISEDRFSHVVNQLNLERNLLIKKDLKIHDQFDCIKNALAV